MAADDVDADEQEAPPLELRAEGRADFAFALGKLGGVRGAAGGASSLPQAVTPGSTTAIAASCRSLRVLAALPRMCVPVAAKPATRLMNRAVSYK